MCFDGFMLYGSHTVIARARAGIGARALAVQKKFVSFFARDSISEIWCARWKDRLTTGSPTLQRVRDFLEEEKNNKTARSVFSFAVAKFSLYVSRDLVIGL